jgi:outer membrane protein
MRSRTFIWCSLLMLSVQLEATAQETTKALTLQQAVDVALKNNLDVRQSGLQQEIAEAYLKQSRASLLPTLNGEIDHTWNKGRSLDYNNSYSNQQNTTAYYSINGNLTLFNGLRLMNTLKSNQYAFEATRMEWQESKDRIMLDVILAYLDILTNSDLLAQAYRQADVTEKQIERLEIMNKEGAVKPSDLYDMRGQLGDSKLAIINNQNNLNAAKLRLAQLMAVPYDENLQVERLTADQFDLNYSVTVDSIYQVALQQLALVKGTELRKKSAEKAVQAAKGTLFPTVGLGAGYNTQYFSTARDSGANKIPYVDQLTNNYNTYAGVGITIPILNGFRSRTQVTLARISLKNASYIAENTQIQLKQAIERDHLNMQAALNRYGALIDQVNALTESFHAAEIRFNSGVGTSIDYLTVKTILDRANANLIIARYDYVLRTKILDYYQAKPLW